MKQIGKSHKNSETFHSGNILLTHNDTAKLGDFGLAMYYR